MGFRDMGAFNQALLAKQIWRLVRYPNSLIAQLLKAKYYPDRDIMEAKLPSNCSFTWRSLLWGRELLKKGLLWKIGDGRDVRVFGDAWVPNLKDGKLIQENMESSNLRVAEHLDDQNEWDMSKLTEILLPVEIEVVIRVERSAHHTHDFRYWRFEPRGEYTVKLGYLVASNYFKPLAMSSADEHASWWKYIWSFDVPQKVRIFAWRVFRNIIPTEFNLYKHHVPVFGRCGWCRKDWGTMSHVLLYCEKVRHFWMKCGFWGTLKKWEGNEIGFIGGAMRQAESRESFEKWIVGMWLIWKSLCDEKYKDRKCKWTDLENECSIFIENYVAARRQAASPARLLPKEGGARWIRPRKGRVRLDVDYAIDEQNGLGGVGAIARDENGNILFAMAKPVPMSATILHGELKALVHGVSQCVEEGLLPVEAFSDSILAVHVLLEEREAASVLCEDMFDFFSTVKNLNVISINHTRRKANRAAHDLARVARGLGSTCVWHDSWPQWLLSIVSEDLS